MLVDSHCHVDMDPLAPDQSEVLNRARAQGVGTFLNICTHYEEAPRLMQTAQKHSDVWITLGVHPNDTEKEPQHEPEAIREWLLKEGQKPKVVGFGETGLDFYRDNSTPEVQESFFRVHLDCARHMDMPVIIHTRHASEATLRVLKEYGSSVRGVLHCFTGSLAFAQEAVALGYLISFSGVLTFPKNDDLRATAQALPLDHILVETDAPFLAPVPYRGKTNEPGYVVETAKVLAQVKGMSLEEVAQATTDNFFRLFSKAQRPEIK
jgi:TatD DNase family protein